MYQVLILPHFKRQTKTYFKKYRQLKSSLLFELERFNPQQQVHLGQGIYKIRLSSKVIILLVEVDALLVPITLYFKGDQATITKQEINDQLEIILFEFKAEALLSQ